MSDVQDTAFERVPVVILADGQEWMPGVRMAAGSTVTYDGVTYTVIAGKTHISQEGWESDVTTGNLFEPVKEDWEEWVQPYAHNPYMTGARVTYQGQKYESAVDNNVYAPGVVPGAWKKVGA